MDRIPDVEVMGSPLDVPQKWMKTVDDNVLAKLPQGTKILNISPCGASYWCGWTRTLEIQTKQADGSDLSFFLKLTQGDIGKPIMRQEYLSMNTLHDVVPNITPKPIAWGTYAASSNIHFFLSEFIPMTDYVPNFSFMESLADLHNKGLSPNGKYGFPITTYRRTMPQYTEWTDSWEEFFYNSLKLVFHYEAKMHGLDPEIQELEKKILEKVVPRLLRPLETGGRTIQPRLIHGDIWDGNVSTKVEDDAPMIFDACCTYAHNEVELAPLRPARHKMGKSYIKAYFRHFPVSPPERDQDDRNALYCLRWEMNGSAFGNIRLRHLGVDLMKNLVAKYPEGYEGWARDNGEIPVERCYAKI